MKLCLTAFAVCCIHLLTTAQDTIVSYRDELGNTATRTNAHYQRKTIRKGAAYEVFEYYLSNNQLKLHGHFSDEKLEVEHGHFLTYFESGKIATDRVFIDGKIQGKALRYYENGLVADNERYQQDKLEDTSRYYHENGQIASIEVYEMDSLKSFELFHEDGTKDTITTDVNRPAEFPGGKQALYRFLGENLVYPKRAIKEEIEGRCSLRFIIDTEGNVAEVKVREGVAGCRECDAEAIRVVQLMPRWTPGISHNRVVNSYYNMPITFKLKGRKKRR